MNENGSSMPGSGSNNQQLQTVLQEPLKLLNGAYTSGHLNSICQVNNDNSGSTTIVIVNNCTFISTPNPTDSDKKPSSSGSDPSAKQPTADAEPADERVKDNATSLFAKSPKTQIEKEKLKRQLPQQAFNNLFQPGRPKYKFFPNGRNDFLGKRADAEEDPRKRFVTQTFRERLLQKLTIKPSSHNTTDDILLLLLGK